MKNQCAFFSLALIFMLTSGCVKTSRNNNLAVKPNGGVIELTCQNINDNYFSEQIVIDTSKNSIVDNKFEAENVIIDRNIIKYNYDEKKGGPAFKVTINRTTGKMYAVNLKENSSHVEYSCELVNPKF